MEKMKVMTEANGQEFAQEVMGYVEGYAQPKGDYAEKSDIPTDYLKDEDLDGYAKTAEVSKNISEAIAASEKKIFGDGELAEAFDTIKEIGDYLKDHDSVAVSLTAEIGKKVSQEEYEKDKETFETKEEAEAAYQPKGEYALKSELPTDYLTEDELEGYMKSEELEAVDSETIKGWFAKK